MEAEALELWLGLICMGMCDTLFWIYTCFDALFQMAAC